MCLLVPDLTPPLDGLPYSPIQGLLRLDAVVLNAKHSHKIFFLNFIIYSSYTNYPCSGPDADFARVAERLARRSFGVRMYC